MNNIIPQYEPQIPSCTSDSLEEYFCGNPWLTEFKKTRDFEMMIEDFLNVRHCSVVPSGTMALSLALLAGGIKPGDKVIVPALTMIATANAVKFIGAEPVFVDIEAKALCMNVSRIIDLVEEYSWELELYDKIKAIIYVSLNGRAHPDLLFLKRFCKEQEIILIEDACQSFGSCWEGQPLGTYVDIGCFSFSPQKIITTGQGGVLVTNDHCLADNIKALKDFGREKGGVDIHPTFGINAKFTDLQAVVGIEQIKDIGIRVECKREIYDAYYVRLHNLVGIKMFERQNGEVPWFVDIYLDHRNGLEDYLKKQGIMTRFVYPPIPFQGCYTGAYFGDISLSNYYSKRGLWLPSSLNLSTDDIDRVCDSIKAFLRGDL